MYVRASLNRVSRFIGQIFDGRNLGQYFFAMPATEMTERVKSNPKDDFIHWTVAI